MDEEMAAATDLPGRSLLEIVQLKARSRPDAAWARLARGDARTLPPARAAELARYAEFGEHAEVKEALQAATMWNYIYTPAEYGPFLPVSRAWNFVKHNVNLDWAYVIFDWDNIFASYMTSLDPRAKDIAYSNYIQVVRSRTARGMVPNYSAGGTKSVDRTEPPIGAKVLREMHRKYGERHAATPPYMPSHTRTHSHTPSHTPYTPSHTPYTPSHTLTHPPHPLYTLTHPHTPLTHTPTPSSPLTTSQYNPSYPLTHPYAPLGDDWLVELLFDDLLRWSDWFAAERMHGPLGLVSLGSDHIDGYSDSAAGTMQGSRFESGLDNSPMYVLVYDGAFF